MIWSRKNRILLAELVKTDFKLRYQGSVLGYLWAVIRPLLMFGILYLVFSVFLRFGDEIPYYPVYLLVGTVLWSFFTECTAQGIQALVQRGDLIRKIAFPKWIVVVSATATALINLAINLLVVLVFVLVSGISPGVNWLIVPVLVIELYVLSLGLSLGMGALNVRYRDVGSIWEVLVQALFYAVPIIYPLSMVMETNNLAAKVLMLNPIAQIIQDVRWCLVTNESLTSWGILPGFLKIIPMILVAVMFVVGMMIFQRKSKFLAEEI